jgi:hypothetical protein
MEELCYSWYKRDKKNSLRVLSVSVQFLYFEIMKSFYLIFYSLLNICFVIFAQSCEK